MHGVVGTPDGQPDVHRRVAVSGSWRRRRRSSTASSAPSTSGATARSKASRTITAPASPWAPPLRRDLPLELGGPVDHPVGRPRLADGESISWKVVARNAEDGEEGARREGPRRPAGQARGARSSGARSAGRAGSSRRSAGWSATRDGLAAGNAAKITVHDARFDGDGPQATNVAWVTSATRDVYAANDAVDDGRPARLSRRGLCEPPARLDWPVARSERDAGRRGGLQWDRN